MTNSNACNELADCEWLTGAEAAAIAADLSASTVPLHLTIEKLRRTLTPSRAHLVVELVELRRRAAAKFTAAERMFFTRTSLEQATDEWVAAYKASRFAQLRKSPGAAVIADLCCGVGGDLLALARHGSVIGIDRDPISLHLGAANARAVLTVEQQRCVDFHATDVEQYNLIEIAAWHIDPDRRPGGRRTSSPEWSNPSLETIERMLEAVPHAAIKLAPAAKVPPEWEPRCELEWISRGGECRQLVAWHGSLAKDVGRRRATIVVANQAGADFTTRSIVGVANRSVPISGAVDRYVFDVDPAVLAAHLKGELAAEHQLSALGGGATYLTGPSAIVDDPALDCFEVVDTLSLRLPTLMKYFRERGIGRLEIKKRGVEIEPELLRRQLKLSGESAAVLLITSIQSRTMAIVARRL